jgi:hypothetical protein
MSQSKKTLRSSLQPALAPRPPNIPVTPEDRASAVSLCVRLQEEGHTLKEVDEAVGWLYGVNPKTISRWRGALGKSVRPYNGRQPAWAFSVEPHGP